MGSSIVMIWSVRWELIRSIIAASVVDLPLPVVPVTSTMPRRSSQTLEITLGQVQLLQSANLGGHDTENHADVAALLENVHTKPSQARHAIGQVQLGALFELLFLPVRHYAEGHVQHLFRCNAAELIQGEQLSVDPQVGEVAYFYMEVGSLALHSNPQQIIYLHAILSNEVFTGKLEHKCRTVSIEALPGELERELSLQHLS